MKEAKYSVGEHVILQSSVPHEMIYNGEHIVKAVVQQDESFICRISGEEFINNVDPGIGYVLEEILPDYSEPGIEVCECFWAEEDLRKKHTPSSQSFDVLMNSLKSPLKDKDRVKCALKVKIKLH